MIYVPWCAEFVLECSGAVLAHRKRLKILSALLAWRALADLVTFPLYVMQSPRYATAMWIGRAIQYAILYALGVQLAAKIIKDYRPFWKHFYMVASMAVSVTTYVFVTTKLWEHKFFYAEAASSLLLLAVVLIAGIPQGWRLEEPWRTITAGLLLAAFGNLLCSLVSRYWSAGRMLYPVPAILALLIWNLSVLPRKPKPVLLEEARLDLGKKHPVSHFLCGSEHRRVI